MLTQPDQSPTGVDPADLIPLCDEGEFDQEIAELVAEQAPRLFAVVQEYGERADGRIAAWGLEFEDRAKVVGVESRLCKNLPSAQDAALVYSRSPHITARVVWANPAAPAQSEDDEAAS